jgi:DNA-binding MarR family transcriptional regulator
MAITKNDYMLTWASLMHAGTHLPAELGRYLQAELGLSLAEQDLLKQLMLGGGELKLSELSQRIYLSKAGITKMMDRLQKAGFVKRVPSKTDRRVIMARLTKRGAIVLERSFELLGPWVEANLRQHLDDNQLLALKDSLESLLKSHDRWEGQVQHLAAGKIKDQPYR